MSAQFLVFSAQSGSAQSVAEMTGVEVVMNGALVLIMTAGILRLMVRGRGMRRRSRRAVLLMQPGDGRWSSGQRRGFGERQRRGEERR